MIDFYNRQMAKELTIPEHNPSIIKWYNEVVKKLEKKIRATYSSRKIRTIMYRPFFLQFCHYDSLFNQRHNQLDIIFPTRDTENLIITLSGNSAQVFDCLMTRCIADLHLNGGGGQGFPRFIYSSAESHDMRDGQAGGQRVLGIDDESDAGSRIGSSQSGVFHFGGIRNQRRTPRGYL